MRDKHYTTPFQLAEDFTAYLDTKTIAYGTFLLQDLALSSPPFYDSINFHFWGFLRQTLAEHYRRKSPQSKIINLLRISTEGLELRAGKVSLTTDYPTTKVDESNRLHAEQGKPALFYPDYQAWFWHGVHITEKISLGRYFIKDIFKVHNIEQRRAMIEIKGLDWLWRELAVTSLVALGDSDLDNLGNPMTLIGVQLSPWGLPLKAIQFIDPSSSKKYFHLVDPRVKTCKEARASLWNLRQVEPVVPGQIRHGDVLITPTTLGGIPHDFNPEKEQ